MSLPDSAVAHPLNPGEKVTAAARKARKPVSLPDWKFGKTVPKMTEPANPAATDHLTTLQVAGMLGMAVRSVQMMVDRGELQAWKTPGGHRRISRQSVQRWLGERGVGDSGFGGMATAPAGPNTHAPARGLRVLVIEDSAHYQNLIHLLLTDVLPDADVHIADDGIAGLAMVGSLDPDVLIVDILLPGIDGATLVTSLRSHPQFRHTQLIIVTSLDEGQRAPYAFALAGVPVVHKPQVVRELPALLLACAERAANKSTRNRSHGPIHTRESAPELKPVAASADAAVPTRFDEPQAD